MRFIQFVFQLSCYAFFNLRVFEQGSTSLMYFSSGQIYLFTLHLKYSIIHFNVSIIFTSTSKICGRFALKWIHPDLLKSIRPMTNNHAWIILPPRLRSSVLGTILEIYTIASSILNIFCIKSSLQNVVDHYLLSLSF